METTADIKELNYSQLMFIGMQQIQSIGLMAVDPKMKLFNYTWAIRSFAAQIPKKIKDEEFNQEESDIKARRIEINRQKNTHSKEYSYENDFENVMELFESCVNLLGRRGLLYANTIEGKQK